MTSTQVEFAFSRLRRDPSGAFNVSIVLVNSEVTLDGQAVYDSRSDLIELKHGTTTLIDPTHVVAIGSR